MLYGCGVLFWRFHDAFLRHLFFVFFPHTWMATPEPHIVRVDHLCEGPTLPPDGQRLLWLLARAVARWPAVARHVSPELWTAIGHRATVLGRLPDTDAGVPLGVKVRRAICLGTRW